MLSAMMCFALWFKFEILINLDMIKVTCTFLGLGEIYLKVQC